MSRTVGRYALGGLLGAVVLTGAVGLVVVTLMHYAKDLGGLDIGLTLASVAIVTILLSPFVGLAIGLFRTHRRGGHPLGRASRSQPPGGRGPRTRRPGGSPPPTGARRSTRGSRSAGRDGRSRPASRPRTSATRPEPGQVR